MDASLINAGETALEDISGQITRLAFQMPRSGCGKPH